ncbi:hypothetical protein GGF46_002265 [Coemansia sp. RSA 552]|nr:hypothetical protein GGF46_002265 [Coemansia sp. RSA 552]
MAAAAAGGRLGPGKDVADSARMAAVLDTNYFIDHLPLIRNLTSRAPEHGLVVIVPWVVLQELDGLKMSSRYTNAPGEAPTEVGQLARSAIRYLDHELDRSGSALRCQKRAEYLVREAVNDDRILDCCLYFMEKKKLPVAILTKDRNLAVKARANGCASCGESSTDISRLIAAITTSAGLAAPSLTIYIDELPQEVEALNEQTARLAAHMISREVTQYMCDTQKCALTSLILQRLEKDGQISYAKGSQTETQVFSSPPWTSCTTLLTVVLYYWDVFQRVFPKTVNASIRGSLPWIMDVEHLSKCPQTLVQLPSTMCVDTYKYSAESDNVFENARLQNTERNAETAKLILLAKRLLAQCALVESDWQQGYREELVQRWITWQKINSAPR